MKNNLELLERLGIHEYTQFSSAFHRMEKATKRMEHMTNILLWSCREAQTPLEKTTFSIDTIIPNCINENVYLLSGKEIVLDIQLTPKHVHTSKPVLQIICNNIIRNAFQHCMHGTIRIHTNESHVSVINDKSDANDGNHKGFGLGLQITKQLTENIQWDCVIENTQKSFSVVLTIP